MLSSNKFTPDMRIYNYEMYQVLPGKTLENNGSITLECPGIIFQGRSMNPGIEKTITTFLFSLKSHENRDFIV